MVKILLVEDNPLNQDMLSRRLTRQGYQVVAATDGAVALSMAKSEKPDLILMDMNIPIIDGWEATRRLKADDLTQPIPVIALTAHAMVGDREKALAAGCDDYATKPVEFKPLLKLIRSFTAGSATEFSNARADAGADSRSAFAKVSAAKSVNAKSLNADSSVFQSFVPEISTASQSSSPAASAADSSVTTRLPMTTDSLLQNRSAFKESSPDSQSDNPFTLLLVNDNAVNREIMNTHLQRKGYSVIEAGNQSTAIAILGDFAIDLILLDITVPETANLELLQQLRSQHSKQALPVVIVSNHSSDEEIVQAFGLGVNDYITKPINLAILMARIQSQLDSRLESLSASDTPSDSRPDARKAEMQGSEKTTSENAELAKIGEKSASEKSASEKSASEKSASEKSASENLDANQRRPIVTGILEPLPQTSSLPQAPSLTRALRNTDQGDTDQGNTDQALAQPSDGKRSEGKRTTENLSGFRDRTYSINHIFSKTPFSQVQLAQNPNTTDRSLCLIETFSPNIEDDAVLDDFRSVLAVERSQLKEISKHDRIADLLGFFKRDGDCGWLQAYTEGMLLSESLSAGSSNASPQAVLQAMREMLEALVPFHNKRLVHCSIQPQHIWRCSTAGSLRLINLGLSQRLAAYLEMRSPEHHKGFNQEHSYMPIEQRIGQPELSSDVYSVGLIALQLLTGKTPSALTNVLLSSDSFSQRLPSVPASMIGLFSKMLAQDSQERYASTMEALKGLDQVSL